MKKDLKKRIIKIGIILFIFYYIIESLLYIYNNYYSCKDLSDYQCLNIALENNYGKDYSINKEYGRKTLIIKEYGESYLKNKDYIMNEKDDFLWICLWDGCKSLNIPFKNKKYFINKYSYWFCYSDYCVSMGPNYIKGSRLNAIENKGLKRLFLEGFGFIER